MTQTELAERWRISEATLERWRTEAGGPLFLKLGNQVRYQIQDVEAFEEVALRGSTKINGGFERAATDPRPAFRPSPHVAKSARPITIWLRTGSRKTRLRPLVATQTYPVDDRKYRQSQLGPNCPLYPANPNACASASCSRYTQSTISSLGV
jgi:hypothetical protein